MDNEEQTPTHELTTLNPTSGRPTRVSTFTSPGPFDSTPPPGSVLADRYVLVEELGRGGMGVVCEAIDRQVDRMVAIKLVPFSSPNAGARFLREAEVLRSFHHPAITKVVDFGMTEGHLYLVMERLFGLSAQTSLTKTGPLSEPVALAIIQEVLDALAYVHARHVIHRDIKPGNIFLLDQTRHTSPVSLLDFGISHSRGAGRLTGQGRIAGTPACVAPEQITGEELDERVDVYGAGLLLYCLLSGENPFQRQTSSESFEAVMRGDVPPLDSPFDNTILKALACDRDERFRTIHAFKNALAI